MIKRWIALWLALCCLIPAVVSAETTTLTLLGIEESSAYRRANPEIEFQDVEYNPWSDSLGLIQDKRADVVYLSGWGTDVHSVLNSTEILMNLSGSEVITGAVSRMMPWIQELVIAPNGELHAVPLNAMPRCFSWRQEGWEAAGFTAVDVPQSYEELLDFLDAWCDRLDKNPDQPARVADLTLWNTGTRKYNYCWWLMEMLLACYSMQRQHAGTEICFDTPEFIALVQRTHDVALRLYKLEPHGTKAGALPELFNNGLRGGRVANDGRSYEFSHAIPMRLTSDQPPLTRVGIELAVIPANCAQPAEAVRFLEDRVQNVPWRHAVALFSDFAPGDYSDSDSDLVLHIDAGWLQDYREYEGIFCCCPNVFSMTRDGETSKENLMMKFFKKDISAETFAQRLDKLTK